MAKLLKHKDTGIMYPYSTILAQRPELELVEVQEKAGGTRSAERNKAKPAKNTASPVTDGDDLLGDLG